jgi:hypothetical protein
MQGKIGAASFVGHSFKPLPEGVARPAVSFIIRPASHEPFALPLQQPESRPPDFRTIPAM